MIPVRTLADNMQADIDLTTGKENHSAKFQVKITNKNEFISLYRYGRTTRPHPCTMEFRTPLHIKPSRFKIGYDTPGLVCGSCFAERIGQKRLAWQNACHAQPYGLLFNPASIAGMLDNLKVSRSFSKRDLIRHNGRWISLQHHGRSRQTRRRTCCKRSKPRPSKGMNHWNAQIT